MDGDGYAVLAGLNPYRTNIIGLDPRGLPLDVEIDGSAQMVAPRRGAIVKLAYENHVGQPLLLKAVRQDGSEPPFGAEVVDGRGDAVAVVGQGGSSSCVASRGMNGAGSITGSLGRILPCPISRSPPAVSLREQVHERPP
ncbi:Outer membrane usher protein HtrE precursor [compost metagenome]